MSLFRHIFNFGFRTSSNQKGIQRKTPQISLETLESRLQLSASSIGIINIPPAVPSTVFVETQQAVVKMEVHADSIKKTVNKGVGASLGEDNWNSGTNYRGFMINPPQFLDPSTRATALAELKSWKVNVVRWQMNVYEGQNLSSVMRDWANKIEPILGDFRKARIKVILDLHPIGSGTSTFMQNLEKNKDFQKEFFAAWKEMATRFKNNPAIDGYDILNEPGLSSATWNSIAKKTIQSIRSVDDRKSIILESIWGNPDEIDKLPVYDRSDKIVYSFHMYAPANYTHQGIDGRPIGIPYNSSVENRMNQVFNDVRKWQEKNKTRVFVGEFSVNRAAPDTTKYLKKCMDTFQKYGWNWTYHAYDEASCWNLKLGDQGGLKAIKSQFAKNESPYAPSKSLKSEVKLDLHSEFNEKENLFINMPDFSKIFNAKEMIIALVAIKKELERPSVTEYKDNTLNNYFTSDISESIKK